MSRINSKFKTTLASVLIACIVLNLFPLTLLALDEPYYSVSEEYEFSVTKVISSRWEDHANIDFTITNNGDTTIDNWFITTDLPYEVENIWNASISETSDSYITISSAPQNQLIEPGCSVTFGITGYSEDDSLFDIESSFYLLNIEDVIIPVDKYQATTNVYSTTEEGFSGAIAITNISSELLTIENVVLNSTNGLTINGNAAIEDETTLVVDASSRNIYPSASIYINFEGTNEIPEVLDLRYTGLAFTLTEDENENGVLDIDEFLYPEEPEVTPTPTIIPTNTPEVEPTETPTVTPEEEPTPSTTPEVDEPTPIPEEVTPTPTPEITEEYLFQDDDFDGLLNGTELLLGYDPSAQDSDGNGILDADEDYDYDGLSNGLEFSLGTYLDNTDSDYDSFSDYDEINIYGTNPTFADTDGDGILDEEEFLIGKNPNDNSDGNTLILQTITTEINNVEDSTITSVDITMEDSGYLGYSTYAEDLYNIDVYSTEVAGRIGSPIGLNSTIDFDSATVVIHYDDAMLGDTDEDRLGVLWFDEEHGVYIVQDQAVIDAEQNTVTLELEHFSTYILVDIDEWRNAFDVPEVSNGYLVVEYSTSYFVMGGLTNEDKIEAAYTVDEYEQRCFNMWANSAGNYRRNYELVSRISGNRTQVDSMQFVHDYVWLVRDVTDRDNDGVYDCYEEDGILGTNGRVYNMRSSMIDSDSDGLSDLEELGNIYTLYRGEDGRILILNNDGEVLFSGEYYIPETSEYYFLRNYVPGAGKVLTICSLKGHPNKADSDNDSIIDSDDDNPFISVIYGSLDGGFLNITLQDGTSRIGGNQSWFETMAGQLQAYINGDVSLFDLQQLHGSGCGITCAADIFAYLSLHNDNYSNAYTGDFTQLDYTEYMLDMSEYIERVNIPGWEWTIGEFQGSLGVSRSGFERGVEDYAEDVVGIDLNTWNHRLWNPWLPGYSAIERITAQTAMWDIRDSIDSGYPVAMRLFFSSGGAEALVGNRLGENNDDDDSIQTSTMRHHWVTIIGYSIQLSENGEDWEMDLLVCSWGNTYTLPYDEVFPNNDDISFTFFN